MRILTCLSTLFFLVLVGCGDQSAEQNKPKTADTATDKTVTETPATDAPAAVVDENAPLAFEVIGSGPTAGVKADMTTVYKLDTAESWQAFWADHTKELQPAEPAPTIDFNSNMLIAVVDTDQPSSGYELSIDKLEAKDKLYVFVTRKQPGAGCVNLGMISQPFVIIQVPKSDLVPELRLTTNTVPCN